MLPAIPFGDPRYGAYTVWESSMEPTLRIGDGIIVRPTDRYDGDGLYVLMLLGQPDIWRLQTLPGPTIRMSKDNKRWSAYDATVDQIEGEMLAKVCWTCQPV
jgi:phage repressor protein C with HTH and peptisase S24 domain